MYVVRDIRVPHYTALDQLPFEFDTLLNVNTAFGLRVRRLDPPRIFSLVSLPVRGLLFLHSRVCSIRVLHGMRHKLVAKQLINLLQSPSLGLRIEEVVARSGNQVQCKEQVKVLEANRVQRVRGKLGEDQIHGPVGEGRQGVPEGSNFDGEDFGGIYLQ